MRRLVPLPLEEWPSADREAWEALFRASRSLFADDGRGRHLREPTRRLYRRIYGLWLAHLAATDGLETAARPADRVTPARLDGWLGAMREAGRSNSTAELYLRGLHAVLALLQPGARCDLLLRPGGVPLRRLLPSRPKAFPPLDVADVMPRVRALHEAGMAAETAFARRTALRDAALLALFITRGPRVSSVAAMRLGTHLNTLPDGRFACRWPEVDIKVGPGLGWPLDAACSAMVRDYLDRGRPLFSGANGTDLVWLGNWGEPLSHVGISGVFMRRTRAWFGEAMGSHMARKWLRSSAARRSPTAAFDAAEVLRHSPAVSVRHYADARELGAKMRHGAHIRELRRQTAGLAERLFAETDMIGRPESDEEEN